MRKVATFRLTADLEKRGKAHALDNLTHDQLKNVLQKHGSMWWLVGALPMLMKDKQ